LMVRIANCWCELQLPKSKQMASDVNSFRSQVLAGFMSFVVV
jgi:hypothetical protein